MPWGGNKPRAPPRRAGPSTLKVCGAVGEQPVCSAPLGARGVRQQGVGRQVQVPEAPMGVVPVGHFGMCFGGRADEMDGGH